MMPSQVLRARSRLGKYRILRRLGEGGNANVYAAHDTLEGHDVALKVPTASLPDEPGHDLVLKEVRMTASLQHPSILPLKSADYIEGRLVMVFPLGDESLADRIKRRMSTRLAVSYARQLLDAMAYAHDRRVLHLEVKPDNMILLGDETLCLSDFGIARTALRTLQGSGTGTVGYVSPEQALGRPSFRSDVFSLGLVLYRMFAGTLPAWPFQWPPPNAARLRAKLQPAGIDLIRRAMEVDTRRRFPSAVEMHAAFERLLARGDFVR
jgi:eukaryotic-like serine/threonine-protein kinase